MLCFQVPLSLRPLRAFVLLCLQIFCCPAVLSAWQAVPSAVPASEVLAELESERAALRQALDGLAPRQELQSADGSALLADALVFEKAAAWMLRFQEFPKPGSLDQLRTVLSEGRRRIERLQAGQPDWHLREGTSIRGYVSTVDGSVQPYAVTLPAGVDPSSARRWPLYVVLHGRADDMNEASFIARMDGRGPGASKDDRPGNWIQLDVYGRGNNAYRWAGETDVFESLAAVRQRFRIDEDRVVLHGFSMGGAGAWHLGLHHPHVWCSVGAGAGFVDFYAYQKKNPESPADRLPFAQHETLGIYDAVPYALNLFNVPCVGYGGDRDPQLLAATTMQRAAETLQVPLKLIIGRDMGHAFDPASRSEFMAFHAASVQTGRPRFGMRDRIRFTTQTLKYNRCDWLAIHELLQTGKPALVETEREPSGAMRIRTDNISLLTLARDIADEVEIDGTRLECRSAAGELLPDVWYRRSAAGWDVVDYQGSRDLSRNPDVCKRPGLQGPIDDAFMSSFVCVRGTGQPLHPLPAAWSERQLEVFREEFARWMRGEVRVVNDVDVTPEMLERSHLVLFGDPGSNLLLRHLLAARPGRIPDATPASATASRFPPVDARVAAKLPFDWNRDVITVGNQSWPASAHGLCLIFPNPLNRSKYVVLNTGHTFGERDFRASNAWLFPRLGDAAVLRLSSGNAGPPESSLIWSDVFDSHWQLR
ncbi:MAG: alpha/beta hydrolase-fold protein [Planctomycetota bacterium]